MSEKRLSRRPHLGPEAKRTQRELIAVWMEQMNTVSYITRRSKKNYRTVWLTPY